MKFLGKKIVKYGEHEFIGDEYATLISEELWKSVLLVASKEELNKLLETQFRFENFEAAAEVHKIIEQRTNKTESTSE